MNVSNLPAEENTILHKPNTKTSNMPLDFLIEQNNKTLAFLKAQCFVSAVESALFALRYLKALEAASHTESHITGNKSENDRLDQCMLLSEIKDNSTITHHQDAACTTTTTQDFLYEHGIILHESVVTDDDDSSIVTPILLFNTALAHHLAVQAGHFASPFALLKARRLYELAYRSVQGMDYNLLFQFALINNIAMIDRKMGNLQKSNECLEYLMSMFMVLVDRECTAHLRHVHGFLVNIPLTSATAGAA